MLKTISALAQLIPESDQGLPPDRHSVTSEMHQLAESLGNAIDAKDHHTRCHSEEVAVAAQILALSMGLAPNLTAHIHIAGHLHDVGKIGVSDKILLKPGPLSEEEWEMIRKHPVISAEIIAPIHFMRFNGIVEMVRHHHESYDGQGYPDGLAGNDIPLGARIIAVVDSLSAMLQDRPYRKGMTFGEAIKSIKDLSGVRYDPDVVRVFLDNTGIMARVIKGLRKIQAPPPKFPETAILASKLKN